MGKQTDPFALGSSWNPAGRKLIFGMIASITCGIPEPSFGPWPGNVELYGHPNALNVNKRVNQALVAALFRRGNVRHTRIGNSSAEHSVQWRILVK